VNRGLAVLLCLAACSSPLPPSTSRSEIDLAAAWPRFTIYNGLCDATHQCSGADGTSIAMVGSDMLVATPWEQSSKVTVSVRPTDPTLVWPTVVLPCTLNAPEGALLADVDGDGNLDVIVDGDASKKKWVVFGPPIADILTPIAWTCVEIVAARNIQNWLQSAFADLDGDGRPDVIAGGRVGAGASVGYFTSPTPRISTSWTWHSVSAVGSIYSIVPLDVDGDGDLDLVISDGAPIGTSSALMGSRLLVNPTIGGGVWANRMIHTYNGPNQSARFLYAEVDGAGGGRVIDDSSIEPPGANTGELAIRTTSSWATSTEADWTAHSTTLPWSSVMTNAGRIKAAWPGDLDGDGCEDVVVTMHHADSAQSTLPEDLSGVAYFHNDCMGGWQRGEISGPEGYHFDNVVLVDVDGDGCPDAVTSEQQVPGATVAPRLGAVWYRNPGCGR
jgi:hypothetical protein